MNEHSHTSGCREYLETSRRHFLGAAAGSLAAAALSAPAWMPRVAVASSYRSAPRDVMIAVFLRGGLDGLSVVVPYESAYVAARPTMFVPRHDDLTRPLNERCINLNAQSNGVAFGLNPNLGPLQAPYNDGRLLFVHACGSMDVSRSHFGAQNSMESARVMGQTGDYSGWLGRHLQSVEPMQAGSILRGVGIGGGLALTMAGAPQTLPLSNLATYGIEGWLYSQGARQTFLSTLYNRPGDPLMAASQTTLATLALLQSVHADTYVPTLPAGISYPEGNLGTALKQTAALLKAQVGVEAVAIDYGSFDHHASEGPVTINGSGPVTLAVMLRTLAQAMRAFYHDLQASPAPSYTLCCMSEFGRRLAQNANWGTDHGWANCMMVMGPSVAGGRVMANWPGLNPGQLFENSDLAVTIDYRDILAEVVAQRLGNPGALAQVFPNFTPTPRGVFL